MRDQFGRILLVVALVLGVIGAVKAPTYIASPLHALDQSSRTAMAWIAANAPPAADFLVVSGSPWPVDATSEWFPVLSGHRSLATLQGYEWLGKAAWNAQWDRHRRLQTCTWNDADCLSEWARTEALVGAWIYVPVKATFSFSPTGDCCAAFRASLGASPEYDVVYSGQGGDVFRPRS
jgi:hypothetical protein